MRSVRSKAYIQSRGQAASEAQSLSGKSKALLWFAMVCYGLLWFGMVRCGPSRAGPARAGEGWWQRRGLHSIIVIQLEVLGPAPMAPAGRIIGC